MNTGLTLTRAAPRPSVRGPWQIAWTVTMPLAVWLGLAKTLLVMNAIWAAPEDGSGAVALVQWLWWFTSLRILLALLAGVVIQRRVFPQRRWAALPIAAAVLVALGLCFPMIGPDHALPQTLRVWFITAGGQVVGLAACLWRDAISVAIAVSVAGLLIALAPGRARRGVVVVLQVVVLLLCALVGIDLAYQFATGQPASTRVLLFALLNAQELAPLLAPEATPWRVLAIAGGVLVAAAWAWHHRALGRAPLLAGPRAYAGAAVALPLALAVLLPAPAHGVLPLLRHTEGTLITLAQTAAPTLVQEVQIEVAKSFERTRMPRWHSANMVLAETAHTRRRNVVIVMIESMRAESTTVHTPTLPTTPFLQRLARQSLVVEDMTAVIPRTAAAWMAVLGGQYPLSNEGTRSWAAENRKQARIRTLPSALRAAGYATSFFTPTDLHFQSDVDVVDTFDFESVHSEQQLKHPDDERVTYFGIADELMVQPILDWTAAQAQAHRPFFTAIMTNVGHHSFETPSTWRTVSFEGVTSPRLHAYYNCMLYIDGVLSTLMEGYRRLGVLDDTIFVLVGDHGQMFEEHGARQIHNAIYQEGLHVPALIYAPGMALKAGTVRGPRQQIDILPTVAELLGYRVEGARLPGQSLLHAVDADRKLYYTSSIDWSFLAARHGPRKYIFSFDRQPMEVFDLDKDPKELAALRDVDPLELASAQREMVEWRMQAELAMLARPGDGADGSGPWLPR